MVGVIAIYLAAELLCPRPSWERTDQCEPGRGRVRGKQAASVKWSGAKSTLPGWLKMNAGALYEMFWTGIVCHKAAKVLQVFRWNMRGRTQMQARYGVGHEPEGWLPIWLVVNSHRYLAAGDWCADAAPYLVALNITCTSNMDATSGSLSEICENVLLKDLQT